jgi:hypothetical protein
MNFPSDTYSADQVQAMGELLRLLKLRQQQQQQQGYKHDDSQPQQQQQQVERPAGKDTGAVLSSFWDTARQLLLLPAGRVLLDLTADAAQSRLQAWAALTGLSAQQVLQRFLGGNSWYSDSVLELSPGRLEQNAAALQQQLLLTHADVQALLCRAPALLAYRTDSMEEKVVALTTAFQACCEDAGLTGRNSSSSSSWVPHGSIGREGLIALQQAVLHTPAVLLLSAGKVVQRLDALQHVCRQDEGLAQQLQDGLTSGGIGRWLTAGMLCGNGNSGNSSIRKCRPGNDIKRVVTACVLETSYRLPESQCAWWVKC